jgi:ribonuclease Z
LFVLGTASQVPTRQRNHNGYFLRWDGEGFLFDPGEGTQRQLTLAGIPATAIHHICITHFHGDHCLGLPGILQRLAMDQCEHDVHIYYPESGQVYFERLRKATISRSEPGVVAHPIATDANGTSEALSNNRYALLTAGLDHTVPALGYRLQEHTGKRFLSNRLDAAGVRGPMVGELERNGSVEVGGRTVRLDEVTVPRPGSVFAFVMDTRPCAGADALARDADLLLMEATYTNENEDMAVEYGHSTAADAARTARNAGGRRLAITHFSQRYADVATHLEEAAAIFPQVTALKDLDRIVIPRRAGGEKDRLVISPE